jgi:hypothetical protein
MRGTDRQTGHLGGYVDLEAMVPQDHPLRVIRPLVNPALERLSPDFDQIHLCGRPSPVKCLSKPRILPLRSNI